MAVQKKICLLGDPSVGKTSLVRQFISQEFDEKYISTIGTAVNEKDVHAKVEGYPDLDIKFIVWDIAGQITFSDVEQSYFRGAKGALIVCDLTSVDTLNSVVNWISRFGSVAGDQPFVILANKSDLLGQYDFQPDMAKQLADRYDTQFFLTSAKTGEGVEEAFAQLAWWVARKHFEQKERE